MMCWGQQSDIDQLSLTLACWNWMDYFLTVSAQAITQVVTSHKDVEFTDCVGEAPLYMCNLRTLVQPIRGIPISVILRSVAQRAWDFCTKVIRVFVCCPFSALFSSSERLPRYLRVICKITYGNLVTL
jgi:hypothetical protein